MRCDSNSRYTGGVIIFKFKDIYKKAIPRNLWCLFVKTKKFTKNWKFGIIYRSPSGSIVDFLDDLSVIIDQNINLQDQNILVDNFNIDINKNDLYSNKLNEILSNVAMKQCVMFDTRIT